MLEFWNIVLTIIHWSLTFFNLTGWIWKATRKAHLITLGLTLLSWAGLGFWYGWGYCFLTDIHWDIKEKLGEKNLPSSFIKYYADKISGKNIPPAVVDTITLIGLVLAIVAAIYVNFIRNKRKEK